MGLNKFCSSQFYDSFPCGMRNGEMMILSIVAGALAVAMAVYLTRVLAAKPRGTEEMNKLSDLIQKSARSFLVTEYKYLTIYGAFVFAALVLLFTFIDNREDRTDGIRIGGAFVCGAMLSALAGWFGMIVATDTNVKTAQAAKERGLNEALTVAFAGGSVMGFTVVGLGLTGLSIFYILLTQGRDTDTEAENLVLAMNSLIGYGFGASSIALFARVAGGIYTKAADVGADLVGKVEHDIPEDDPRNPAVIADNVGDNVGDVAGMGADLFESNVGSIIAAATLANGDTVLVALPFWIAGAGAVASLIGFFFVSTDDNIPAEVRQKKLLQALHRGTNIASALVVVFSFIICWFLFDHRRTEGMKAFGCIIIGLAAGMLIGLQTEYFTSYANSPTRSIANAGITGPATVVIQGLGIGMLSCVPPICTLVVTIVACDGLSGQYGVALSAVGMLSTLAITLATDAYGPIADNAGGIAEMAHLDKKVRETTDALDALGNTTAATGKGFSIGSAVLSALGLLAAFQQQASISSVELSDPIVLSGVLFGALLPFLFAAMTMLSVRKAAGAIIIEVRRQFHEIPGLREGNPDAQADPERCVEIATQSAVQEMVLPGIIGFFTPLTVGFLVGPSCLAGMLSGSIASGAMLAIMMSNAGGAWDNSKKYIELENALGGKGTAIHRACVVGDTIGDPFKDTSGPALNLLIKMMCTISLCIAPVIRGQDTWDNFYYGFIPLVLMIALGGIGYMTLWRNTDDGTGELPSKDDGKPVAFAETEMVLAGDKTSTNGDEQA